MIAFRIADMKGPRCAKAVTTAVNGLDRAAVVRVDLAMKTVEIESVKSSAKQLGDAIRQAGYSAEAV